MDSNNRRNIQMKIMSENIEKDHFKQTIIDPLEQLNIRFAAHKEQQQQQQQHVWPTMQLFSNNLKLDYGYPQFNCK